MSSEKEIGISSISNKYPSYRDHPLKSSHKWLEGRRKDDGAEGLWRIHDTLYDLTDFIDQHPGGREWLSVTKGTDITEAFEAHHISLTPERMLPKYKIRDALTPRNYKLTFKEDGFYRTLKKRVREELPNIDRSPELKSKIINDSLVFLTFFASILSAYFNSYIFGIFGALFLTWTVISAHNYFHRKDNWRMLPFNLSFMSYREWRISHAMSHHLYTNSLYDLEISLFEPLLCWLPNNKNLIQRYGSWLYGPIVYFFLYFSEFIKRAILTIFTEKKVFYKEDFIPFLLPAMMYLLGFQSIFTVLKMWIFIVSVGSFIFLMIGLNAAHHHPEISHHGDSLRENLDWGIYEIETVMERSELKGSQFLVQTHFGEHGLHHLFPTLDHGILPQLKNILIETCNEFETQLPECSGLHHLIGQHQQLARITTTTVPRDIRNKKQN